MPFVQLQGNPAAASRKEKLYEQMTSIPAFRERNRPGPRITHVKEVWSRHRVQKLSPSKQSLVCLQVIWKSSCWSIDWSNVDQWSAPWATVGLQHSTESALLKVKNDIVLNMDAQKVTSLVLVDLSAAFDTVRHDILLDRLRWRLGVTDQAFNWFTSYHSDRTQRVAGNGGLSDTFPLAQGSCLGPLLFTVYTSELFDIVDRHLPSVLSYADETQLYLAFSPNVQGDDASAVKAMCDCIMDLRKWMIRDQRMLNDDKTEFLLLGTKQQLAKVDINSITVGESVVNTKPVVRNLVPWFDSQLSMSTLISKLCSSAFFHLHNLHQSYSQVPKPRGN